MSQITDNSIPDLGRRFCWKNFSNSWWHAGMFLWVWLYIIPISLLNGLFLPEYIGQIPIWRVYNFILTPYINFYSYLAKLYGHVSLSSAEGSSDTGMGYFYLICSTIFAIIIAFLWALILHSSLLGKFTIRAQNCTNIFRYIWQHGLRLCLASTMIGYGIMKAIPVQMPLPYPGELIHQIGDQSGMGYLWNWIGFSPPMEILCGVAELIGGILLLIPRFITLGGYISLAMMGLVLVFVFCYDVDVKILAAYVCIGEFILLFPSLREFYQYFIHKKAINPPQFTRIITTQKPWLRRVIIGIYILVIGIFSIEQIDTNWQEYQAFQLDTHIHINGRWAIDSKKFNNPQLAAKIYAEKWITIVITALHQGGLDESSEFAAGLISPPDGLFYASAKYTADTIELTTKGVILPYNLVFHYRLRGDILTLEALNPQTHHPDLIIVTKRAPWRHHPGEFHWVQE